MVRGNMDLQIVTDSCPPWPPLERGRACGIVTPWWGWKDWRYDISLDHPSTHFESINICGYPVALGRGRCLLWRRMTLKIVRVFLEAPACEEFMWHTVKRGGVIYVCYAHTSWSHRLLPDQTGQQDSQQKDIFCSVCMLWRSGNPSIKVHCLTIVQEFIE